MTPLAAWTWLRRFAASVPAWAWGALAVALALGWEAHSAHRWHSRAVTAETSLASVRAAQVAVNKAAAANKVRVETAQSAITTGVDHDAIAARDAITRDYADYRRLHPPAARGVAVACHVPGVPDRPAVADGAAGAIAAKPAADIVDIAEQGDVYRAQVVNWQAWYAAQAAARVPVSAGP